MADGDCRRRLAFLRPVKKLLDGRRLDELEAGPTGVKFKTTAFDEGLTRIEVEVTAAARSPTPGSTTGEPETLSSTAGNDNNSHESEGHYVRRPQEDVVRLYEVAAVSPVGAVFSSFQRIEAAVADLARLFEASDARLPWSVGLRMLVDARVVDHNTVDAIEQLSNLRNLSAHGDADLDPHRANEFIELSNTVISVLQRRPERTYEIAVTAALRRIAAPSLNVETQHEVGDLRLDAAVRSSSGLVVAVDVRYSRGGRLPLDNETLRGITTRVAAPMLLVSNIKPDAQLFSGLVPTIRSVVWRSPADDGALRRSLEVQMVLAGAHKPIVSDNT